MISKVLRAEIIEEGTYHGDEAKILTNIDTLLRTVGIIKKDGSKVVFDDVSKLSCNEKHLTIYHGFIHFEFNHTEEFMSWVSKYTKSEAVLRRIKMEEVGSIEFIEEYYRYKSIDDKLVEESKED